jgi:hypothetical protein
MYIIFSSDHDMDKLTPKKELTYKFKYKTVHLFDV